MNKRWKKKAGKKVEILVMITITPYTSIKNERWVNHENSTRIPQFPLFSRSTACSALVLLLHVDH